MYVGGKLRRRPWDAELRTLQEYQWRDGGRTLWWCGGRCRGSRLDGIQLGWGNNVIFTSAAAPFALARVGAWRTVWHSRE